jgi:putative acetyltransferase
MKPNKEGAMIRTLVASDLDSIEDTFFNSFSAEEAPITYAVIKSLISENDSQNNYCIGYELDGKVVSAVGFSPVCFDTASDISAYILAPIATHKLHQQKGIATKLIDAAKAHFIKNRVDALLVYGDPAYYGRYGFDVGLGKHFAPPYPLEYEFGWQAMMLSDRDFADEKLTFTCVNALSDAALW